MRREGWQISVIQLLAVPGLLLSFFLWLYLMWQALQGRRWHAPVAGDLAERFAA